MSDLDSSQSLSKHLDEQDELRKYRQEFNIPKDDEGRDKIYFCGNSLGLQPKKAVEQVNQELRDWGNLGVDGHLEAEHPWLNYHEFLTDNMAKIVGAKPIETVIMNTLTTNLHLLMVSFYRPTKSRYKILIESDAFPSDKYAVESQILHHGFSPEDSLIQWYPHNDSPLARIDDLEKILKEEGEQIALILVGAVNYYTGQYFDLKKITSLGHLYGCKVGFDCAHAAGNVPLNLHDSNADFAAWCSYKYLNAGPGSLSGIFVHEKYAYDKDLPRFSGWWSHNKKTRFKMRDDFDMLPGAEGWQLSNPPILSMAAIKASLEVFAEAGFSRLVEKSRKLTSYFQFLIEDLNNSDIEILTPTNPEHRGCQLSIRVNNSNNNLFERLTSQGIVCDWREPNVIRCAPVPLYNTFSEVWEMVSILKKELGKS